MLAMHHNIIPVRASWPMSPESDERFITPLSITGPPHCFTDEEMLGYWGKNSLVWCNQNRCKLFVGYVQMQAKMSPVFFSGHKWNITRIHYEDVNNDSKREKGVEYFNEQVHHLTLK